MPKRNEEVVQVNAINPSDPAYCPHCGKLSMATFPVHLREKDGNEIILCHIVRCPYCKRIKNYGTQWAIGKLKNRKMYADYENWPELKRNGITPDKLLDAIFSYPEGQNFWLDALNGLKPVKVEGNAAKFHERLQAFLSTRNKFWRAYD